MNKAQHFAEKSDKFGPDYLAAYFTAKRLPKKTCCQNRVALLARHADIKVRIGYLRRPSVNGGTPSMVAHDTLDWQCDVGRTRTGSRWSLSKVDCSVSYTGRASATEINSRKCTDAARSIFGPSMRSVTVDVIVSGISLREHVLRSLSGVHRVTHHDMRKRLLAALDLLERAWQQGRVKTLALRFDVPAHQHRFPIPALEHFCSKLVHRASKI